MNMILLHAETRTDLGKGASRRLRRLENLVPGVIYGGKKPAHSIHVSHNKLAKALECESIFSSVFDIKVDDKVEHVILKDLQRHPWKPVILHMDLQRVDPKDILVKSVPLHFLNEQTSKGVKAGGIVNHALTQVEVRCKASQLPEFIEVDLAEVLLNGVVHLSDLKLPKGVRLTADISDASHNHPVVSIHTPKVGAVEETEAEGTEAPEAPSEEA
ncbi:50S ribosomal protein L25/general stress protein Ctc [Legionella geestiana]|nr:50S ribosomal protein L25/general stress protein Ctc [Legionella geestiana]QBS12773.1 50S ribosomal protein L25/general stress protein Ctc [Legionella geestiana]QDQ39509.1 50S ribosomal protein L25/general stress protein Ctc [Legionella geestiana]